MNTLSHVLLGRLLHQYIKDMTGIQLDKGSFILGNALPDFTSFYLSKPHYLDSWIDYLQDEISTLTAGCLADNKAGRDESKRLGVICHFFADFFCYAHTQKFTGGTLMHMRYEWRLYRHTRRFVPVNTEQTQWHKCMAESAEAIYSNFKKLQAAYHEAKPSFHNDLCFSFQACAEVIMLILKASEANAEAEIAISVQPAAVNA
jgi:hypothetical protein